MLKNKEMRAKPPSKHETTKLQDLRLLWDDCLPPHKIMGYAVYPVEGSWGKGEDFHREVTFLRIMNTIKIQQNN